MTARILNVTEDEYHKDPCATPSLSASIAQILITESPLHAWLRHPRLGATPDEATVATNEGTVLHKLLLGKGAEIAVINMPDFRTNAAKEARDSASAAGQVPIIKHKFAAIEAAAAMLRERCEKFGFPLTGESEVAIEWTDETEAGEVLCRSRLDHVFIDAGVIYDVKKSRSVNPKYLAKNIVELGYDLQQAAYTRALAALKPELEGRIDFVFLFCELDPPHSVVPVRLDGAFREIGTRRWQQALYTWERCLRRSEWPGYCDGIVTLDPPAYVLNQYLADL